VTLGGGLGEREFADDFDHQAALVADTWHVRGFGILWEPGVAKSRPTIETAVRLYENKHIDGVIVLAPDGVHRNWITDELPRHCRAPWIGVDWDAQRAKVRQQIADVAQVLGGRGRLLWLAMTYDGLKTPAGLEVARAFRRAFPRYMLVIDESSRVAGATTARTKICKAVAIAAACVRILNGTPVGNSPLDLYSQIVMIDEHFWRRHGIASYTAFEATFAVKRKIVIAAPTDGVAAREPASSRKLVAEPVVGDAAAFELAMESGDLVAGDDGEEAPVAAAAASPVPASRGRTVEVIAYYRDLDKLHRMIAPITSRLTKEQAGIHLPPKLYTRIPFELAPIQRAAYDKLKRECMLELEGKLVTATLAIVKILRLQQIACGYLPNPDDPDAEPMRLPGNELDDPRMLHAIDLCASIPYKAIIWARFRHDVDRLCKMLGDRCVRYDGAVTSSKARAAAIDAFRGGDKAQFFVANPAAIGVGVTLVEAKAAIYYSNSFKYDERIQSEARCHRVGQHNPVTYYDLVALRTVDEKIQKSLIEKNKIAAEVVGDDLREWLS
jgi:hypothetical protein